MNLQILKNNLTAPQSKDNVIQFVRDNKIELEQFFVVKSEAEIEAEKYDLYDICLEFIGSAIFQSEGLKEAPEIVELLTLFAALFESIGFTGGISIIKANLPSDSSIRKRLDAVTLFMKIADVKVDYIQNFGSVLTSLQKAQDFAEFDYTGQVVQDTINYYLKGTKALTAAGYTAELNVFKTHFNSTVSRTHYKFLNHPNVKEYLDGYVTEKIIVEVISGKIYMPSSTCQKIFQNLILDQIFQAGYLNRYGSDEIRADILNYGRSDFTKPYKDLSTYDKTQLYCYFNMRKHFFSSYAVYEKIYTSLDANVFSKGRKLTFIDFGSGPITSGLALASLHHDRSHLPLKVNYVYIDIADSMLQKAKEFSVTPVFDNHSEFYPLKNWEDIDNEFIEKEIIGDDAFVIFNASYLFASSSLNEKSLADFVNKVTAKLNASTYFIFQNPDRADRNQKYQNFKRHIYFKVEFSDTQKIYYRNKRNSYDEPSSENVNFEILSL